MSFWKRLWAFLLSETTVDDKIIAKVNKVKKEVSEVKFWRACAVSCGKSEHNVK